MANQYPPTRDEYVASVRHQAANIGGALGMAAAIALVATSGVGFNLLTVMLSPMALFVGAGIGMAAMAVAGSLYAGATYRSRYGKEFAHARELAAAMAEDPLATPNYPPLQEQALAETPDMPPPEPVRKHSWASMFHRQENHAQRIIDDHRMREIDELTL